MNKKDEIYSGLVENRNKILFWGLLLIVMIATSDFVVKIITTYWVEPIMSEMYDNAIYYFIASTAILIFYYNSCYIRERYYSKTRVYILAIITFLYSFCLIYNLLQAEQVLLFTNYSGLIFVIPFLGELFLYERHRNQRLKIRNGSELLLDKPINNVEEDYYSRSRYSEIIAQRLLNNFHEEGSFVVGLTGDWGFGKTSFINLIKIHLNGKEHISIDFKPWLSSSPEAIVADFITQLSEELSIEIPGINRKLNRYINALSNINQQQVALLIDSLKLLFHHKTISAESHFLEISSVLQKTKIKVIVYIDDTDRLSPSEVAEVMKLVRNSANFPYMQFIVTYDRNYLINALGGSQFSISDPNKYLEKIFNVELSLPQFEDSILKAELNKELNKHLSIEDKYKQAISLFIDDYKDSFPIEKIIMTKRDLVRFVNALKINIKALDQSSKSFSLDDINIVDFVKIELIRFKDPNYYNRLLQNPLSKLKLSDNEKDFYIYKNYNTSEKEVEPEPIDMDRLFDDMLGEEELKKIRKLRYIEDSRIMDECMSNLFSSQNNTSNSISNIRAFDQYFRYQYDESNIAYSEIVLLLIEQDSAEITKKLEEFSSKKKYREIERMFSKLVSLTNKDKWNENKPFYYKNVLKLIYASLDSENIDLINEIVESSYVLFNQTVYPNIDIYIEILVLWDKIMSFDLLVSDSIIMSFIYEKNLSTKLNRKVTDEDKNKIESFLRDAQSLDKMARLLYNIVDPDSKVDGLIFSEDTINDIRLSYFMKYAENNTVDKKLEDLFYSCANLEPKTRRFLWNKEATERFRSLIDNDVRGYIDLLIVYDNFYLYPPKLWKALFNEKAEDLDAYLKAHDKVDGIKYANLVWNISKHNGLNEVNIQHLPYIKYEKIEFLRHLEKDYNNLLDIKGRVEKIVDNDNEDISEAIKGLNELREELNSHPLRIRLTGDLIDKIDKYINENSSTN